MDLIEKLEALKPKSRSGASFEMDTEWLAIDNCIEIVRQHQADALQHATNILATFKPEGQRTKYEELEACYAALFRQLVAVTAQQQDEQPKVSDSTGLESGSPSGYSDNAGSSNGRTADFDSANRGSSPCPAANLESVAYRMADGRPIFGKGSPHDVGEHLGAVCASEISVDGLTFGVQDVDNLVTIYNEADFTTPVQESLFRAIKLCKQSLRTTEPVCPYILTSPSTSEGDGGTSYCSLAAKPEPVATAEIPVVDEDARVAATKAAFEHYDTYDEFTGETVLRAIKAYLAAVPSPELVSDKTQYTSFDSLSEEGKTGYRKGYDRGLADAIPKPVMSDEAKRLRTAIGGLRSIAYGDAQTWPNCSSREVAKQALKDCGGEKYDA